uniref:Uncharacterized protein n=1 Tax=Sphaerodactylus townsendi TaxID=933632 RepID=A0ACB8F958_9SAUR
MASMNAPGSQSVIEYAAEFCQVVSRIQATQVHMFKNGLEIEVLQWVQVQDDPDDVMAWICLVREAEWWLNLLEIQAVILHIRELWPIQDKGEEGSSTRKSWNWGLGYWLSIFTIVGA